MLPLDYDRSGRLIGASNKDDRGEDDWGPVASLDQVKKRTNSQIQSLEAQVLDMQRRLGEKDLRQSGLSSYGVQNDGVTRGTPGQERLSRWQMRDQRPLGARAEPAALAAQQAHAATKQRAFLHPPPGLASSPFSAALGSPFGGAPGLA